MSDSFLRPSVQSMKRILIRLRTSWFAVGIRSWSVEQCGAEDYARPAADPRTRTCEIAARRCHEHIVNLGDLVIRRECSRSRTSCRCSSSPCGRRVHRRTRQTTRYASASVALKPPSGRDGNCHRARFGAHPLVHRAQERDYGQPAEPFRRASHSGGAVSLPDMPRSGKHRRRVSFFVLVGRRGKPKSLGKTARRCFC